jgi:anti-sigma factor RsiW
MNCEDCELFMADAIGEELDPSQRASFSAHLAQCPKCREEYESAMRAVKTMRELPGPRHVAVRREGDRLVILGRSAAPFRLGRLFSGGVFRYAASVLIAFAAGYALHAGWMATEPPRRVEMPPAETSEQEERVPGSDLQGALAYAHNRSPSSSHLAKALMAVAHGEH